MPTEVTAVILGVSRLPLEGKKKQSGSNGIHVVWLESIKAFHEVYKETNVMQSIVGMMRIYRVEHLVK